MTSLALPARIYYSYEARYQLASKTINFVYGSSTKEPLEDIRLDQKFLWLLMILIKAWFAGVQGIVSLEKNNCCSMFLKIGKLQFLGGLKARILVT